MDNFGAVRALASAKHDQMLDKTSGRVDAVALLVAARATEGITVVPLPPDHPLLANGDGALHRETRTIYLSAALSPQLAAFVEAHEFGHWWVETPTDHAIAPKGVDPGTPEEPTPLGLRRVEAYSPQELRERHANVFAREFLLPRNEARRSFIEARKAAGDIATARGVPIGLVHQQLAVALLLPEQQVATAINKPREIPNLDPSQIQAAEHVGTPLLVEAGPGTGKTRTLIARIAHLLSRGVGAAFILTLTFSNKAAREIRERVAAASPAGATELWAGTFHAFGLELLRKYGHLEGIVEPVRLLDQADALALLEGELPVLGLDHYLRLHEPLLELRHILSAISRAKDELFSPLDYAAAATHMHAVARNDEEHLRADKAAEVARVYACYEQRLRTAGFVDFADLINRPIEILRKYPEVREEVRLQYAHVLVDEYQDVNRASALLLKELAGGGERLWVVGDARQSIYRFRGAAPLNMAHFERDYPGGVRRLLAVNYRSCKQIVDTFGAYSKGMQTGRSRPNTLGAERGAGADAVDCHVATNRGAEIAGIAAAIQRNSTSGIAYRDQAVLCRSHAHLEKIALGLEQAGVPVLYLGDLFERPEVCDLLAMLSFAAEPHRGALYRVAALAPYRMPLTDVRALLSYTATTQKTPWSALDDLHLVSDLSEEGCAALERLRLDLISVDFRTGPGAFLCELLFNRGALAHVQLSGNSPADQQRRLAIHQFLQFALENDGPGAGDPKRRLLDWVRRLEVFGDERALREPPNAVDGIDAVRLMTVHASKGLEFRVVHLPTLGAGIFPLRQQGQRCPAPDGMLPTAAADDHDEEEECLFFVALSRARDHLSLTRAARYSDKQNSNASEALMAIAAHLPRSPEGPSTWTHSHQYPADAGVRSDLAITVREHDGHDVDLYLRCPRRYLYQVVLGLSGSRDDTAYVRFHRAVYKVLQWMSEQTVPVDVVSLANALSVCWQEIGPVDHPLEPLYRAAAVRIVNQAGERSRSGIRFGEAVSATVAGHLLRLPIDEIEGVAPEPIVLRRLRTGRAPKKPDQGRLHALMAEGARQTFGAKARMKVHYLTTAQTVDVAFTSQVMEARLADCRTALASLGAGRYPAAPENREDCPRCPHYFICPVVPD